MVHKKRLTRSRSNRRGGKYYNPNNYLNPVSGDSTRARSNRRGGNYYNPNNYLNPVSGDSTRSRSNRRGGSPLAVDQTDVAAPNWIPVGRGQRELGGGGSTRSRSNRRGGQTYASNGMPTV